MTDEPTTSTTDDAEDTTDNPAETDSDTGSEGDDGSLREACDDLAPGVPWSMQDSNRTGARVGDLLAASVRSTVANLLLFVMRLLPFSQKFYRGLIHMGYKGLLKSKGGADAVGHVMDGGQVDIEPMAFKRETDDGPLDNPRWTTADGRWFRANQEGSYRYGQVPLLWASSRSTELGNHVTAEVAEVLDIGETTDVFTDATVQHTRVEMDPSAHSDPRDAVADGGAMQGPSEYVSVEEPGSFVDQLVSLDDGLDAQDDGRVVSMDKYYETFPSEDGPEAMQEQWMLGYLEGHDPEEYKDFAMKVILYFFLTIAALWLGPPLIEALLGGTGGVSVPVLGG